MSRDTYVALRYDPQWSVYCQGELREWTESDQKAWREFVAYGNEFNNAGNVSKTVRLSATARSLAGMSDCPKKERKGSRR